MVHGCAHLNLACAQCRVGNACKNNGAQVCTLKFGIAWCKVGNARKIMVHGCAHLNLALCGASLAEHRGILLVHAQCWYAMHAC
jgi:hypothetical protein